MPKFQVHSGMCSIISLCELLSPDDVEKPVTLLYRKGDYIEIQISVSHLDVQVGFGDGSEISWLFGRNILISHTLENLDVKIFLSSTSAEGWNEPRDVVMTATVHPSTPNSSGV